MIELKKHIHDESNDLWYELVGDYYIPQLTLPTEMQRPIGKWGRMHRDYLKENRPAQYADLILHGNIEPTEYGSSTSPEYKELRRLVDRNEIDLRATMTGTQKELFNRYLESVLEYQTMSELMLFQNSFKLGARLAIEVMME